MLFTSLYFSDPSGSKLFFLSSLPIVAQTKNFCMDPGFILPAMFAKDLTDCFSHCCVEDGNHWIHICIFIFHDGERCKLPAYHTWKVSNTLGSFRFSRSNLRLVCFGLLVLLLLLLFSYEGGRSSSASRGHFQRLLLENSVFWHCSLLIGSASWLECNQSGSGVVHLGYVRSIVWSRPTVGKATNLLKTSQNASLYSSARSDQNKNSKSMILF